MPTTFDFDISREESAGVSARGGRRLMRQYECFCSDIAHEVEVVNALTTQEGIVIGSQHPRWPYAFCVDIKPTRDADDHLRWFIDLAYEEPAALPGTVPGLPGGGTTGTAPGGAGTPYQQPNPVDRPTYFSVGSRLEPRYLRVDQDAKPFLNSADDPLEDVPPEYMPIGIIRAKKFYASWSVALSMAVHGKCNQDTWLGFDPDVCRIEEVSAAPKTQGPFSFWEVDFVIAVNARKWIPTRVLSVGRLYYKGGKVVVEHPPGVFTVTSPKVPFGDVHGRELPGLHLLGPGGDKLPDGAPPLFISFRMYDRINFNGLIDP